MRQKYLVVETQYFFDGHGTPEEGSITKFISDDRHWKFVKKNKYYGSYEFQFIDYDEFESEKELEEYIEQEIERDPNYMSAEDGYNCTACTYKIKKVTEEEAKEIETLIKKYEKL